MFEAALIYERKWALIRNKYFNHKTQHQIKNRVISVLGKVCGLNRITVLDYLKQKDNDLFFHALKYLRQIKKKHELIERDQIIKSEVEGINIPRKNLMNYIDNFEINENFCSL